MPEEVQITGITRGVLLLDKWIEYALELECELARLRVKYANAHERCEQLRAIVAEDYPASPF